MQSLVYLAPNLLQEVPQYAAKLNRERQRSLKAIKLLIARLRPLLKRFPREQFSVGFEWPRGNDGWKEQPLRELRTLLPEVCQFDGCMYGLENKKPWQVLTNFPLLATRVNKLCDHKKPHRQGSGKFLRESEN